MWILEALSVPPCNFSRMIKCTFSLLIFLVISATSFHIPSIDLTSSVDVDSSRHNSGLVNSYLQANWSQSLNVGSLSVTAILVLLFITIIIHLRTTEKLNLLFKHVEANTQAIHRRGSHQSSASRSRGSKASPKVKSNSCDYAQVQV